MQAQAAPAGICASLAKLPFCEAPQTFICPHFRKRRSCSQQFGLESRMGRYDEELCKLVRLSLYHVKVHEPTNDEAAGHVSS